MKCQSLSSTCTTQRPVFSSRTTTARKRPRAPRSWRSRRSQLRSKSCEVASLITADMGMGCAQRTKSYVLCLLITNRPAKKEADKPAAAAAAAPAAATEAAADKTKLSKNQLKKQAKKEAEAAKTAAAPAKKEEAAKPAAAAAAAAPQPAKKAPSKKQTLPSGLVIEDNKTGSGPTATSGKRVQMRYIGRLQNGKIFDQNTKGAPFSFKLGKGEVSCSRFVWMGSSLSRECKLTSPPTNTGHQGLGRGYPGHAGRRRATTRHPSWPCVRQAGYQRHPRQLHVDLRGQASRCQVGWRFKRGLEVDSQNGSVRASQVVPSCIDSLSCPRQQYSNTPCPEVVCKALPRSITSTRHFAWRPPTA